MGAAILDRKSWGPPSWTGSDVIGAILGPILLKMFGFPTCLSISCYWHDQILIITCGDEIDSRGVWCTINRSHSTPCKKAEFEHLQIFPGHCLDFFLPVSGKICHSPIKKVKRQHTLIISFSQHSPFFEEQSKNLG